MKTICKTEKATASLQLALIKLRLAKASPGLIAHRKIGIYSGYRANLAGCLNSQFAANYTPTVASLPLAH